MVKNQPLSVSATPLNPSRLVHRESGHRISYFKVPADQRIVNPQAYNPHLFSFGLYHAAHDHCVFSFGPHTVASHTGNTFHRSSGGGGSSFSFGSERQPAASADPTYEFGGIFPHDFSCNSAQQPPDVQTVLNEGTMVSMEQMISGGHISLERMKDGSDVHIERTISFSSFSSEGTVSLSGYHHDVPLGHTVSLSSYCSAGFSNQPSSCATAIPNDGDHFKILTARALGLRDRTQLIDKIKQHDFEFRNMYVQMRQAQLDLIDADCLADVLGLDGITIVAATMPPNITRLIYPITRLVLSDAILLENQVPILVVKYALESITSVTPPEELPPITLEAVLRWYCERVSPFPNFKCQLPALSTHMKESLLDYIYDYLTEAQYDCVLDSVNVVDPKPLALDNPALPSASRLERCGIKFHPCDGSFKGIYFDEKNTVLYLPRIGVADTTVRFLHNLLAYEATARYPREFSVISYAHFMDRLIDTEEDVWVLVEAGVIRNALGSNEELASMWNKLCNSVSCRITPKDCRYMNQLEALTKRRSRKWRAAFRETYWERQPWLLISLFAAIILLVLAFLQTFYTMKTSLTPPS